MINGNTNIENQSWQLRDLCKREPGIGSSKVTYSSPILLFSN